MSSKRVVRPGQLADKLRSAGVEHVDESDRRRAEYSSDASLYRVLPTAVVFPRSPDEIELTFEVCRDTGVPVTMRGGGTSIAGNAIGTGVVVDCSRHLDQVLSIDPESRTAVAEPGVVLDDLQRAVSVHGLRFGPDPSSHSRATVGGMIGNNACGSRALRYGRTVDNVVALDALTGGGHRITVGEHTTIEQSSGLAALEQLIAAHLGVVRTEFGRFGRQVSGYALEQVLPESGFNVAKMLTGSEGTLAQILSVTVRLTRPPALHTLVVLGFPAMADAADAVVPLIAQSPVAIEGFDAHLMELVAAHRGRSAVPPLPNGGGWLFVEVGGDDPAALADAAARVVDAAQAVDAMIVDDPHDAARLWRIREDGAGIAARPHRGRAAHAGWEDAAVPPAALGAYLRDFEDLLVEHGLVGYPYGHFGDGCVHVRLDFTLDTGDGISRFRDFMLDAAALVAAHGGSMSGEHGDGRARSELLPRMYSPEALALFGQVKHIFDPDGLLNPGVIVRPRPFDVDLRPAGTLPMKHRLGFAYEDDQGDFSRAVGRCTGVGKCRDTAGAGAQLMCPSFLATRDEKDTTRGRARVLQEMIAGRHRPDWRAPEVHDALDLCLSCKGCATDCPTGTDMAKYKAEVLHQAYRHRIRPRTHYSLGRLPTWARLASHMPRLANAVLRGPVGSLGRAAAGVDPRRDLPAFASETFRAWFDKRPASRIGDPLVLWVDTFTNHFDPGIGKAAVRVLEGVGYAVQIPERQVCCGLTYLSTGQLDKARNRLRKSLQVLEPASHTGVPIVALEPSCAAVFRDDAAELLGSLDHPGLRMRTLAELLSGRSPQIPDLTERSIVAQPHCHHRSVMGWDPDRRLLTATGGSVDSVAGCCGLAGNFGAERGHFETSLAVAETYLLPAIARLPSDGVVVADGFSCRTQIMQFTSRRALHTAELLAGALPPRP